MSRTAPLSLIQIEDRYIARRQACTTGHWRRAARAAYKEAHAALAKWGFAEREIRRVITDAVDMYDLERIAPAPLPSLTSALAARRAIFGAHEVEAA